MAFARYWELFLDKGCDIGILVHDDIGRAGM